MPNTIISNYEKPPHTLAIFQLHGTPQQRYQNYTQNKIIIRTQTNKNIKNNLQKFSISLNQ